MALTGLQRGNIEVGCILCEAKTEASVELPEGWVLDIYDLEDQFCPEHAIVSEFRSSQCPGCVSGWGDDCPLFRSFAYSGRRTITPVDLVTIKRGVCPKRVNGTMMTVTTGSSLEFRELDLSEVAPNTAGEVFASAIEAYMDRYPEDRHG